MTTAEPYRRGTMPEVVWQALPDTRLEVPGRPPSEAPKAADFPAQHWGSQRVTDGRGALTFCGVALCALAYLHPLIRASERKSLAALPPAGGALLEYPPTLIRWSAKCAAP